MQLQLPIAEYKFLFQAIDPVSIPAFADPLWRSVFGLALRQLSCIADKQSCDDCILRHQCDYSFLTTGPNSPPEKIGITKYMKNIPNPHIFHCRVRDYSTRVPEGSTFSASIILIGNANDRLPAVIRAMVQAGMLGLGGNRSKFRLQEVIQAGPASPERLIMSNQEIVADGIPVPPIIPASPKLIRFTFQTPYLLPTNTKIEDGFNATKLIMQIIRRASSLHEPYTGAAIEADFQDLRTLADTPAIIDSDLNVEPQYSYFGNKKRFTAVRGSFIMDLQEQKDLWPWIYLGQWLNVGKQASKGFGRYTITAVDP